MRLRLLFYAVNGLGLGHVTRLLGLARAVRAQVPSAEILFLTSSEAAHVIYGAGFAAIKVPSRNAARAGGLRRDTFLRLTQSTVWNAISSFDPHGIVVDTFATGSLQELGPILGWPLRKIFVFRAQKSHRSHDAAFQRALSLYDLILIPHHPYEEILPTLAPTPAGVATCWTGPMTLRDNRELLSKSAARAALELPPTGKIGLIALGGGDPDLNFARQILRRALRPAPKSTSASLQVLAEEALAEVQWIELAGPLEALALAPNGAEAPLWRTLRGVHPACKYLQAFDGAIGAVGYNTAYELQMAALPCVLWPFPRDVDDQAARAQFLSNGHRALAFDFADELLPSRRPTAAPDEAALEAMAQSLRASISQLFEPSAHAAMQAAMRAAWGENGVHVGAAAMLALFPGAGEIASSKSESSG